MRKVSITAQLVLSISASRLYSFMQLLGLILMLAVFSAQAQQLSARPDRGMSGKGGYQTSEIDSISLQNGSVNLQISLASLPPIAGSKLSYTLTASYNSKLWDSQSREVIGTTYSPGCPQTYSTQDIIQAESGGGWRIGGYYQVFFRDARDDYDYYLEGSQECLGYEFNQMTGKFFKPMLRMPDGSEHELRMSSGYPFSSDYSSYQGSSREHLKGYLRYTGTAGFLSSANQFRMHTIDGTYISIVVEPFSSGYPANWTIYLKDGTQIQPAANGQRTKDTNGNSILNGYDAAGNYAFVRDEQTGREIRWSAATHNGANATKVEYQTVSGAWQNTVVVWGTTTVQGKLYTKQDWNPGNGGIDNICYRNEEINAYQGVMSVIREIIFPATEQNIAPQKFTFGYNSDTSSQVTSQNVRFTCNTEFTPYTRLASHGLGELSDVTTPTGAHIKYNYVRDGVHLLGELFQDVGSYILTDVVTSKVVTHDGTNDTWTYNISTSNGSYVTSGLVTNPDGSTHAESYHPTNIAFTGNDGADGKGGLTYRTSESGKIVTEKNWTLLGGVTIALGSSSQSLGINPVIDTEYITLMDDSGNRVKMSAKKFQYDYNGELLQTIEYDWFDPSTVTYSGGNQNGMPMSVPSGATILRTVNNSYFNYAANANSLNAYQNRSVGASTAILGAMQEMTVGGSSAQTRFNYDGQSYGVAPTKGNVTQVSNYNDTDNTWINTSSTYDTYGNVISKTDPKGSITQIFYEDATHAMPTKTVVDPQNGTGQQIATTVYDFSTGMSISSTDINGNVSSISYVNHLLGAVDPFGRPGTVFSSYVNTDGVNKRRTIKSYYEDNSRKTRVEEDLNNEGDALLKSKETRDQLGRTILTEKFESDNSIVSTQNIYLQMGKVTLSSNPKRMNDATTNGWTRATSDLLGRVVEIASFKGDAQPPTNGTNSNWMGSVITNYYANTKTVTDQAGKKRRGVVDALGRTVKVIEDPDGQNLTTDYIFDSLGNIRKTQQGGQARYFLYNSLSRVIRARQPELGTNSTLAMSDSLNTSGQWSIGYVYDANGNTISTTDARGVTITGTYDKLNRLTYRDYSDATPDVTMVYEDTSISLSKGKLTKVVTGDPNNNPLSITNYTAFDQLGGILASQQTTAGQPTRNFFYTYNLAGNLESQTYPSGRIVKQFYNDNGELSAVSGRSAQTAYKTYVSQIGYTSTGAVDKLQLGNGRWETGVFNSRGQVMQIGLGNAVADTSLLKLEYNYGTAIENNGGLRQQTISVQAVGATAGFVVAQNYEYDSLNRLKSSSETLAGNQMIAWKQTFDYDRFGNRRLDMANTTMPPTNQQPAKIVNPQIDTLTNRWIEDQDEDLVKDYEYDVAGNLLKDAEGKLFSYDAEGRQKSFGLNGSNSNGGQYFYDGQGKRVKKVVNDIETIFIYDAFGKLAAEYENVAPPTNPATKYMTTDQLGSPRIITDQSGQVVSRHDYLAYGEEIHAGMLGINDYRKFEQKYSQIDNVKQQFTGYERDTESSLDYAQARYYNSRHGRFTSVDPLIASASIKNPQTFNRYSYALNSPYKFTDPLGLAAVPAVCGGTNEADPCGSLPTSSGEDGTVDTSDITATATYLSAEWESTPGGEVTDNFSFSEDMANVLTSVAQQVERLRSASLQNAEIALGQSQETIDTEDSQHWEARDGLDPFISRNHGSISENGYVVLPTPNSESYSGSGTQSTPNLGAAAADKANKQVAEIERMKRSDSKERSAFVERFTGTKITLVSVQNPGQKTVTTLSRENANALFNNAVATGINAATSMHEKRKIAP